MSRDFRIALLSNFNIAHCTGNYILKALRSLGYEVVPINPTEMRLSSFSSVYFDLLLTIDYGGYFEIPVNIKFAKSALWAIDTHLNFFRYLKMSKEYDFIFCAQIRAVEQFKKIHMSNIYWVPLGADREFHSNTEVDKKYDLAFVGSLSWGYRKYILSRLKKDFPGSYIGQASHKDIGGIYSSAKLVFNISINDDLNMRIFEALCSDACLITDEVEGLSELFPETPFFTYKKTLCYIDIRARIEAILSGKESISSESREWRRKKFNTLHSYDARVVKILSLVDNHEICCSKRQFSKIYLNKISRPIYLLCIFPGQVLTELSNNIQRIFSTRWGRLFE